MLSILLALLCAIYYVEAVDSGATFGTFVGGLGSNSNGYTDGIGTNAGFNNPLGITFNADSTMMYVVDRGNLVVRQVEMATLNVTTLAGGFENAGYVDGDCLIAQFGYPTSIVMDTYTNTLYLADSSHNAIRSITLSPCIVSTFAGGTSGPADGVGTAAQFETPYGLAIDVAARMMYECETNGLVIKSINITSGLVTTIVGVYKNGGNTDGVGTAALLNNLLDW